MAMFERWRCVVVANPFVLGFVRDPDPCDRTRELDDDVDAAHDIV
jgi:hypothetical protein